VFLEINMHSLVSFHFLPKRKKEEDVLVFKALELLQCLWPPAGGDTETS